ncbi:MAG: UDP-N-acetylglucosamine--N-acetylmuramyl-(pentapeptide) pyrophosphoryl-undecaprenol N-acetylglucosamine transferase [Beijerinckiaceae bacterium]
MKREVVGAPAKPGGGKMARDRAVLLAAGGTGGHLFPAEALSRALAGRKIAVELVTDERATKYGDAFPARAIHQIAAATPRGGGVFTRLAAILTLARGTASALLLLRRAPPKVVVGFGGYPTVPPMFAATILGIPTILHEANAVMGRANRFLAGRVDAVAHGFATIAGVPPAIAAKAHHTGNPVRPQVLEAATRPFPNSRSGALSLLVTGGSQGARVMADIVPAAVALLSEAERQKLAIVQQARGEDEVRVKKAYAELVLTAEVRPFFTDLPERIAAAHLVVARAGASTVAELAVIGRAAILVPLPHALDQDQAANAAALAATGAAVAVAQQDFTPEWLAAKLREALASPEDLQRCGQLARQAGIADAAEKLADLVVRFVDAK